MHRQERIGGQRFGRGGVRATRLLGGTAFLFAALLIAAVSVSAMVPSRLAQRSCGALNRGSIWDVSATPNVRCKKAKHVVLHAASGRDHLVYGFHCRAGRVGQYGWVVKCHRGSKRIRGETSV